MKKYIYPILIFSLCLANGYAADRKLFPDVKGTKVLSQAVISGISKIDFQQSIDGHLDQTRRSSQENNNPNIEVIKMNFPAYSKSEIIHKQKLINWKDSFDQDVLIQIEVNKHTQKHVNCFMKFYENAEIIFPSLKKLQRYDLNNHASETLKININTPYERMVIYYIYDIINGLIQYPEIRDQLEIKNIDPFLIDLCAVYNHYMQFN